MVYVLTLRIEKLLENKIKINTIYNSLKNIKYIGIRASLVAWTVKCLPTMQETWVQSLGWEDPLEKEVATHYSIQAWKIPRTKEPGGLQSMGSQRVGRNWATSLRFTSSYWYRENLKTLLKDIREWLNNRGKGRLKL